MKRPSLHFYPAFLAILLAVTPARFAAGAESADLDPAPDADRLTREIIGKYTVLQTVEPDISEVEKAVMEKAESYLDTNRLHAKLMIEGIVGAGHPSSAAFNNLLGTIYFEEGLWKESEEQYRIAIDKFPNFRRAWSNLGFLLFRQDHFGEAVEALVRSVDLGATDAYTYGLIGYANLRERSFHAAHVAYNAAIMKEPENGDWLEGLVQVLMETGRAGEALPLLDELLENEPFNAKFWKAQANSWLERGDLLRAARNLEIARLLEEDAPDSIYQLGHIYLRMDMPEEAASVYREAMQLHPFPDFRQALRVVRILLRSGAVDEAGAVFAEVDTESGDWMMRDRIEFRLVSAELAEARGNRAAAIEHLVWVTEQDPLNGEALYRLAQRYQDNGQTAEAQVVLERIEEDSNYFYSSRMLLTRILVGMEQYEAAVPVLEQAMKINPGPRLNTLYRQVKNAIQTGAPAIESID